MSVARSGRMESQQREPWWELVWSPGNVSHGGRSNRVPATIESWQRESWWEVKDDGGRRASSDKIDLYKTRQFIKLFQAAHPGWAATVQLPSDRGTTLLNTLPCCIALSKGRKGSFLLARENKSSTVSQDYTEYSPPGAVTKDHGDCGVRFATFSRDNGIRGRPTQFTVDMDDAFSCTGILSSWPSNMWAQSWDALTDIVVHDIDLGAALAGKNYTVQDMVRRAEDFYTSLGLEPMTSTFWAKSQVEGVSNTTCHGTAANMYTPRDYRWHYSRYCACCICTDNHEPVSITTHQKVQADAGVCLLVLTSLFRGMGRHTQYEEDDIAECPVSKLRRDMSCQHWWDINDSIRDVINGDVIELVDVIFTTGSNLDNTLMENIPISPNTNSYHKCSKFRSSGNVGPAAQTGKNQKENKKPSEKCTFEAIWKLQDCCHIRLVCSLGYMALGHRGEEENGIVLDKKGEYLEKVANLTRVGIEMGLQVGKYL
uniref:Uncharacterized protein n=1 Tax=Timema shepardi TaxID=629360 RepID=A0A7R9G235_TIMSH|nr:unnamed protein product [Timema shepardi]